MAKARRTAAQREQLRLLFEAGADRKERAKEAAAIPGLNPLTIGPLRKHGLVDSVGVRTSQRHYTVYWLTPIGVMAAQGDAKQGKPKRARKSKAEAAAPKAARGFDIGAVLKTADAVDAPGFYRMASEIYHADPCPAPALSTGLAHTIVQRSPLHARRESPRFGAGGVSPTYAMDIGSAVHAFAFGDARHDVVFIPAEDWKDARARNWRAAARAEGKTPILTADRARVVRMAETLIPVLEAELGCAIGDAFGEIVIAAIDDGGGWRRTRADLMRADARVVLDVKTTALSAEPEAMTSRLFDQGAHLQDVLTRRILDLLDPAGAGRRVFKFVSIEQDDPHAVSVLEISEASRAIAEQQLDYASACWDRGVAADDWPGYGRKTHPAVMPGYAQTRWFARAYDLGLIDEQGAAR